MRNDDQDHLVGRDAELAEGDLFLEDLVQGRGGGLLILGEPGIGKTALAHAIIGRGEKRNIRTLSGRASELSGAPPLWVWGSILRDLAGLQQEALLVERDAESAGVLKQLVQSQLGGADANVGDRFAMFESVARIAEAISQIHPLLLFLDDIQWADEVSWELATSLMRSLARARVGLVMTCRLEEASSSSSKESLLTALSRHCRLLYPRLLEPDDAQKVFAATARRPVTADEMKNLLHATGGNPMLIQEVGRLAASNPDVAIQDLVRHPAGRISRLRIAERIRDVVEASTAHFIEVVSVLGSINDMTLAREILDQDPTQDVDISIAVGALHRSSEGNLVFAHDMMREAIYDTIPVAERERLHARAAEVLQRRTPFDQRVLYQVATHYLRSGVEYRKNAAIYALAAGRHALAAFAPEIALSYVGQGLKCVPHDEPILRCDLGISYIEALVRSGRRNEASSLLLETAALAKELNDVARLAAALIAYGESFYRAGVPIEDELQSLLEEAIAGLPAEATAQRSILLADIAARRNFGRGEDGRHEALEAVKLARKAEDMTALARALMSWAYVGGPDHLEDSIAATSEIIDIGRRQGNTDLVVIGCSCRAAFHLQTGSIVGFDEDIETVQRIASRSHGTMHLWSSLALAAFAAFIRGDLADSARLSEEALSLAPNHPGALTAWFLDLWVRNHLADTENEVLDIFESIRPQAGWTRHLRAPRCGWVYMLAIGGRVEDARAELRILLEEIPDWPKDMLWLISLAWLANAAALIGSPKECRRLYDLLSPYEGHFLYTHIGLPAGYLGSVAAQLGSLAEAMQDVERAVDHYSVADTVQTSIGDRGWIARVKLQRARALTRAGVEAEARQVALEARTLAQEKGLSKIQARVAALLKDLDDRADDHLTMMFEDGMWLIGDVRLRDMRGLRHIAGLIRHPDEQIHVLELTTGAGRASPPQKVPDEGLSISGDGADSVLDDEAKRAYRARILDLEMDLQEAEAHNDVERAVRVTAELDFVTQELEAAVGLRGRDRKLGSESERARIAVTKAIRFALERIQQQDAELGAYLKATIRTGTFCSYEPRPTIPGYRPIAIGD